MSRLKTLSDLRRRRTVRALRNAGPVGAPGMPEWGGLPIRKKLLALGVRDMMRISDAPMSGTHDGTCILHVSPESSVGGPLACLRSGDQIEIEARRVHMRGADLLQGGASTPEPVIY